MATKILRPKDDLQISSVKNQDGNTTDIYDSINDSIVSDSTYLVNTGQGFYLPVFDDHNLPAGTTINKLSFVIRSKSVEDDYLEIYHDIYISDTTESKLLTNNASFDNEQIDYTNNPATSNAWTLSELTDITDNNFDAFCKIRLDTAEYTDFGYISDYYIIVDYTEASSAYKKFGTITWSGVKKIAGVVEANIKKLGKITKLI